MKPKYKGGGKPKKKRSNNAELMRQMEELALAAKMMMISGNIDPENLPVETSQYLDRAQFGNAMDEYDGDPMYTMRSYPWKDSVVMARNSQPGKEQYSKMIPMDMVREAQFAQLMLPKKKISLF